MTSPAPLDIRFHQQSQILDVEFSDKTYSFSAEYLRVFSPSAEVRGHGGGPLKLVPLKKNVKIVQLTPVGHYAIQPTFDDGHDSGLYTWQTLRELGEQFDHNWAHYLERLKTEGLSRELSSPTLATFKKAD